MERKNIKIKRETSEPFVVMVKPVGPLCNLECNYCYYLDTNRFYENQHQFRMSEKLLEMFISQYIDANPGPIVSFTWHGGEPTLIGIDFYRLVVELQKKYLPKGWTCWNNLQTNGILLNDDWCLFLADANFDVGLSIDGTQYLHDKYRKDNSGKGTYNHAVAAIRLLQAYDIQPDLLCTVTSSIEKEPLAVYRALRDLDTGWIQFIPIIRHTSDGKVTSDSVTAEGYGNFMCSVFDEWIYNDLGRLEIQLFAEMSLLLSGGKTNLCWMAPTCGRVLVVEHDGAVYSCDHFVTPNHFIGNIKTSQIIDMVDSEVQKNFGNKKKNSLPKQCYSCQWLSICNGGCLKDRFAIAEDGEVGLNYLCSSFCKIFEHTEKILKKVIKLKNNGLKPKAIMYELGTDSLSRWRGIGRNDPCPCGSGRKAKFCCWHKRP